MLKPETLAAAVLDIEVTPSVYLEPGPRDAEERSWRSGYDVMGITAPELVRDGFGRLHVLK